MPQNSFVVDHSESVDPHGRTMGIVGEYRREAVSIITLSKSRQGRALFRFEAGVNAFIKPNGGDNFDADQLPVPNRCVSDRPQPPLEIDSGPSATTEDRLHVVTVRIKHEGGVVDRRRLILARARCTVIGSTSLQGGSVESIDFGLALGNKGCVLFDGVWMVTINPEDWVLYTVSDRVSPRILGQLHRPPHAKCAQSGIVKSGGTADIRDSNASVVDHPSSVLRVTQFSASSIRLLRPYGCRLRRKLGPIGGSTAHWITAARSANAAFGRLER
jgi:hypothetical protein